MNNTREEWRKVPYPGFPAQYEVSNFGRFRRTACLDSKGRRLRAVLLVPSGRVIALPDGSKKFLPFAALVLLAFKGPKPPHCVLTRHLNDDPTDNRPENLEWGTQSENRQDAIRNGLLGKGSPAARTMSIKMRGNKHALGHKHSEETRARLKLARKGKRPALGKSHPHTPESRAKLSAALTQAWKRRKEKQACV